MAAPSSKQSPSNQKMKESESAGSNKAQLKDPPPSSLPAAAVSAAATATAGDDAPAKATPKKVDPLSYRASETSESYFVAKQLLNNDDFEGALNVIEEALHKTTKEIRENLGLTDAGENTDADLETEIQMHEALGPLHYLYGTTLLYSLEEARDDGNGTAAMMMTEEGVQASTTATTTTAMPGAAAAAAAAPDSSNPWAHLGAAAANNDSPSNAVAAEADPEDIAIAWENLEAARAIVEKILTRATTETGDNGLSEHYVAKLQL